MLLSDLNKKLYEYIILDDENEQEKRNSPLQEIQRRILLLRLKLFINDCVMTSCSSSDKTIKLWNTKTGCCLETIEINIPSNLVKMELISSDKVAMVLNDNSFAILSLAFDLFTHVRLVGHTAFVHCVIALDNKRVSSCSADKTLKIWSLTGVCQTIQFHTKIHCLRKLSSNRLASGTGSDSIKVWNLVNGECESTLTISKSSLIVEVVSPKLIAYASYDGNMIFNRKYSDILLHSN